MAFILGALIPLTVFLPIARANDQLSSPLIAAVETDRAAYLPGSVVTATVHLINRTGRPFAGTVTLFLRERGWDVIAPDTQRVTFLPQGAAKTLVYRFRPPVRDYRGYLIHIQARRDRIGAHAARLTGVLVDTAGSAVDVSSDWKRFPRYGYVTRFAPGTDYDALVARLNRYHLNGLQFYDVNFEHHRPYSPAVHWPNLANQTISREVVLGMIQAAHARGMMAIDYNLMNGAYDNYWADGSGVALAWGQFTHSLPPGQAYTPADQDMFPPSGQAFPAAWASPKIYLFDPGSADWKRYLFGQQQTLFSHLPFDGWQIDTLGDPGPRWDWLGRPITTGNALVSFTNEARTALGRRVLLNTVSRWNQTDVAQNAEVDFLYSELWEETAHYHDLLDAVRQIKSVTSKAIVFPAYMNTNYAKAHYGQLGYFFNEPSVRLVDAAMLAAGGIHLELGDGDTLISNIYWPGPMLQMRPALQSAMQDEWDFAVAYENLLRDGVADAPNVHVSLTGVPQSDQGRAGAVWIVPKTKAGFLLVHLINLGGNSSDEWRDTEASCPTPPMLTTLPVKVYCTAALGSSQPSRLWWASPDFDHGVSHSLRYTTGTDAGGRYLQFTLPRLHYWDMISLETTALSGRDYNLDAYQRIEAEDYGDSQGLGVVDCGDYGGGLAIGNAFGGRWARFSGVNFGRGAACIEARVATDLGGTIEWHLDSLDGPLLTRLTTAATGGWQHWTTLTAPAPPVTGLHDLYAVFSGTAINLNWFRFHSASNPTSRRPNLQDARRDQLAMLLRSSNPGVGAKVSWAASRVSTRRGWAQGKSFSTK